MFSARSIFFASFARKVIHIFVKILLFLCTQCMIIKIIAINTNAKKFLIFNFYFFKIFLHGRVYRVR
ncbi:MAG: hypothetical protein COW88_00295 [Candidatus Lloydbacteria bacterium CG22_combo_CG10-13_8_21_14_all_47_15]|uniref:Uncharacterized protein n=1 Tax=Candidatus Lloydbacteria bacterium CG22_combo_CG10-13_8_21_14_all_47_15 TaxID=1974635 RepID=A0A2H0CVR2_9BACT|nr:MAG: hypothetical protein COW88_00295 [Candidatus Lloydbacteria bacterium CG22_combo_CG10-13_8_21_14_all_47_15]